MSSTIKCVSCKQRINLAPDASGIVICPMCKTQQPVPEEQGQNAPQLPPAQATHSQASPPNYANTDRDLIASGPINRNPVDDSAPKQSVAPPQHNFDSPKGGCGCLAAGLLLAIAVAPFAMLVIL